MALFEAAGGGSGIVLQYKTKALLQIHIQFTADNSPSTLLLLLFTPHGITEIVSRRLLPLQEDYLPSLPFFCIFCAFVVTRYPSI